MSDLKERFAADQLFVHGFTEKVAAYSDDMKKKSKAKKKDKDSDDEGGE